MTAYSDKSQLRSKEVHSANIKKVQLGQVQLFRKRVVSSKSSDFSFQLHLSYVGTSQEAQSTRHANKVRKLSQLIEEAQAAHQR